MLAHIDHRQWEFFGVHIFTVQSIKENLSENCLMQRRTSSVPCGFCASSFYVRDDHWSGKNNMVFNLCNFPDSILVWAKKSANSA